MSFELGSAEDPKKVLEKLTNELIHVKEKLNVQKTLKETIERAVSGRKGMANRIDEAKITLYRLIYDAISTATTLHVDDYVALIETQCEAFEAKNTKKEAKS